MREFDVRAQAAQVEGDVRAVLAQPHTRGDDDAPLLQIFARALEVVRTKDLAYQALKHTHHHHGRNDTARRSAIVS